MRRVIQAIASALQQVAYLKIQIFGNIMINPNAKTNFSLLPSILKSTSKVELLKVFLRHQKQKSGANIKLTFPNENDLHEHVLSLVENNTISETEISQFIERSEESGGQHIFLYKPKTAKQDLQKKCLEHFQSQGLTSSSNALKSPGQFAWVSFRHQSHDWTVKAYASTKVHELIGKPTSQNGVITTQKREISTRTVAMVSWSNSTKILQIRVSDSVSSELHEQVLDYLNLHTAFAETYSTLDLTKARSYMLKNAQKLQDIFDIGNWTVLTPTGTNVQVLPTFQDESATTTRETTNDSILKSVIHSDSYSKKRLRAKWKVEINSERHQLSTVIGTDDNPNELIVTSKTIPEVIDYVIENLAKFQNAV